MPQSNRVIVGCTHGEENPDAVIVSYLTAGAALDHGREVGADQDPPVKRVHDQFIEKGGRFYVCPVCFKERDLDEGELVENAELKGATPLMEFAAEGALTFTY